MPYWFAAARGEPSALARLIKLLNEDVATYRVAQEEGIDIPALGEITVLSVRIRIFRPGEDIWTTQCYYPDQASVDVTRKISDHAPLRAIDCEVDQCEVTVARYVAGPQTEEDVRLGLEHDLEVMHALKSKEVIATHIQPLAAEVYQPIEVPPAPQK